MVLSVDDFNVKGSALQPNTTPPEMIYAMQADQTSSHLLEVRFETNPLTATCDQCLNLKALPLQIIYNAVGYGFLAHQR